MQMRYSYLRNLCTGLRSRLAINRGTSNPQSSSSSRLHEISTLSSLKLERPSDSGTSKTLSLFTVLTTSIWPKWLLGVLESDSLHFFPVLLVKLSIKVSIFLLGYFGAGESSDAVFKQISSIFYGKCLLKVLWECILPALCMIMKKTEEAGSRTNFCSLMHNFHVLLTIFSTF